MSLKKKFLALSGLAALAAAPAMAVNPLYTFNPFDNYLSFDFSAQTTVAGHLNWATWTAPTSASPGTRFVDITLNHKLSAEGQCYELHVATSVATANPDIQLYTADGRSIDDDGPNGDRKPYARLWIINPYTIRLSAFSNASNSIDWGVDIFCMIATTAAQCDNGTLPFYNQANNSITRQNSLVN